MQNNLSDIEYTLNTENINFKNEQLNIICLNIQSIRNNKNRNKFDELNVFIDSFNYIVHVIILTEVWIYSEENTNYNIQNYSSYFCNNDEERAGGIVIYVHNMINSNEIYSSISNNTDCLIIDLVDFKIKIIGIYRHHSSDIHNFIDWLEDLLSDHKNSILLGDVNLNLLNNTCNTTLNYMNMISSKGFEILNLITLEYATRLSNTIATIIDHVFTDLYKFNYTFLVEDTHLSDHRYLLLNVNTKINFNNRVIKKTIIDYNAISNNNLLNFDFLENIDSFDKLISFLGNIIKSNTKELIYKVNKTESKKPWMTKYISSNIKLRDKFYKMHKNFPLNSLFSEKYKYYQQLVLKSIRNSKRNFFKKEIDTCKNSTKKLWELIHIVTGKEKKQHKTISSITINNSEICNEIEISNAFNNYFVNIGSQNTVSNINLINLKNYIIQFPFHLNYVNAVEIETIIKHLNINSAVGYDSISVTFIKNYISELSFILCKLINGVYDCGIYPNCLKIATVTPIFKHGNKSNVSNYRGISVLSHTSKIVEKTLYVRLLEYLTNNKIIHENQFGFAELSNTLSATSFLMNEIRTNIDQRKFVSCLFIDLQKAFDMVNHNILISKLINIGIQGKFLNILETYLLQRKQKVKIGNSFGDFLNISSGVPQGSILGPLFFNIFINDIFYLKLYGKIQLYADDMAIVYNNANLNRLFQEMQMDLDLINLWLSNNLLKINAEKTNYILFQTKNKFKNININSFEIKLCEQVINRVESAKVLGLIIDEKLNWSLHIKKIKSKINSASFALRKLNNVLPSSAKWFFYHSCIMSHVSYLNPIWNTASVQEIKGLKICINRTLKIIKNKPRLYPTDLLYSESILPIEKYNQFSTLLFIYKIKNKLIKNNVVLDLNENTYSTRQISNFIVNFFRTTIGQNNVFNEGVRMFNKLPYELKYMKTISNFKSKLKLYLYNNSNL